MSEEICIKHITLDHIDKDTKTISRKEVSITDAKEYIEELSKMMLSNSNMREFEIKTDPNPIISLIKIIISDIYNTSQEIAATIENNISPTIESPENEICKRLLETQIAAQNRYRTITTIKKGSLIQTLIEHNNELIYIIALIDHSAFIDEIDLKKKGGLPDSTKATLKSARIHFNADLTINKIFVGDSSYKISEYWYDSFLDLVETTSDISNTKNSYNFIKNILSSKLSKTYKQDYLEYKNSLNVYFLHHDSFNFNECLDFIFSRPAISQDLDEKQIKQQIIAKKPHSFDTIFSIDNSDIKKQLLNTKFNLNTNVELKIKAPLDTIKESIYTYNLDGQAVIVIQNVDSNILQQFNFNNVDISSEV